MRKRHNIRKILIAAIDLILILAATQLASSIILGPKINALKLYTGPTFFSVVAYLFFFYVFELYSSAIAGRWRESIFRIFWSFISGFFSTGFIFYFLGHWQFPKSLFLLQVLFGIILLSIWRYLYLRYMRQPIRKDPMLIIGGGRAGVELIRLLKKKPHNFELRGIIDDDPQKQNIRIEGIPVLGPLDKLNSTVPLTEAKHIILAVTHDRSEQLMQKLLKMRLAGIQIHEMAAVYENLSRSIPAKHIQERWLLFESGFGIICRSSIQHAKQIFDTMTAIILLIISSPLMLITAAAIKMESPGQVLFRQTRVGLNGKHFTLYKFRSMCNDAEKNGAVWARENDPRVTRIGKWIRKLRFDELPQLINILKGDMSLIGPRPERPEFVQKLKQKLPYYYIRHLVRPGITGWAQVNYPYGATEEDALRKLEYDLYYVKNMSIFLDVKIAIKTVGVILFGKGAR